MTTITISLSCRLIHNLAEKGGNGMKDRWVLIIALILLPLLSGNAAAEDDEDERMVHLPYVIDTFDAGAYQYQLVVMPCIERPDEDGKERTACPIVVNLLKGGKTVDSQELPLPVEIPLLEYMYIYPTWDATLYNHDPTQKVWSFGYEQWYVGVLPRLVQLDDKHVGLLVTQNYGFELINSKHVLFTEQRGKLKRIWSYYGKEMFDQSAVYPVEVKGKPYLLYWQDGGDVGSSTKHDVFLLRWDANKQKMESIKLPTADIPLYALSIEFYDPDDQLQENTRKFTCERNHDLLDTQRKSYLDHIGTPFIRTLILDTEDYPGLPQDKPNMWGNLFFTLEEAKKYQEALRKCKPPVDSEIIKLN